MPPFVPLTNVPGGFDQASPESRIVGDATDMNVAPAGATAARALANVLATILAPRDLEVVADALVAPDGTLFTGTDQTAKINLYLLRCRADGIRPRLPRGAGGYGYHALGTIYAYDAGDYDGKIIAANRGASSGSTAVPASAVSPDRKTVTITGLNAGWTGLLTSNGSQAASGTVAITGALVFTMATALPAGATLTYTVTPGAVFAVVPDADDVTDISLATIKGWSGLIDGASQIGGLDPSLVGCFVTVDAPGSRTTGSINRGSKTLTLPASVGITVGMRVTVAGAGPAVAKSDSNPDGISPLPTVATAVSSDGRTITLRDAALANSDLTSATDAAVTFGYQTVIRRAPSSAGAPSSDIRLRDGFYVNDDAGHVSSPLIATWDVNNWSTVVAKAQRVRERITIDVPAIQLYGPTNGQRERLIDVRRCNTEISGVEIKNASGSPFHQGIVVEGVCWVRLNAPSVDGLYRVSTNYGIAIGLSVGCQVDFGTATLCRRGLDSHLGKDLTVIGGHFPDGVGSHYIDGIVFVRSVIGVSNGDNAYNLHFSGRNFIFTACKISLCGPGRSVFRVRSDILKSGGNLIIDGGTTIDIHVDTLPVGVEPTLVDLMGPNVAYDTEIGTEMPDNIVIDKSVRVRMRGNRNLYLLRYLKNFGAALPQTITGTKNITIEPTVVWDDPTYLVGADGHPRCRILYTDPAQLIGDGPLIRIRNVPDLYCIALPDTQAQAGQKTGRASFDIDLPNASLVEMDMQGGGYLTATVRAPNVTWADRDASRQGDESEIQIDPHTGERVNIVRRITAVAGATITMRQDKHLRLITANNATLNGLTIRLPPSLVRGQSAVIKTSSLITGVIWDGNGTAIAGPAPGLLPPYSEIRFELQPDATGSDSVWTYMPDAGPASMVLTQCRLEWLSATSVVLRPYAGNLLWIDGANRQIPSSVPLSNAGLAAGLAYYVYAAPAATGAPDTVAPRVAVTLEASMTAPVTGSVGLLVKSGDPSRTLVGFIGTDTDGTFADGPGKRLVASRYNQPARRIEGEFAGASTSSTSATELSTAYRVVYVSFADQLVTLHAVGNSNNNTAAGQTTTYCSIDGLTRGMTTLNTSNPAGEAQPCAASCVSKLPDGLHTASIFGSVSGGTGTWAAKLVGSIV